MYGPPFRVAHIAGMVAHFTGISQPNEMTETRRWKRDDGGLSNYFLTHVGHLGHHILTPAAGPSLDWPTSTGIGGPLHRNTQGH